MYAIISISAPLSEPLFLVSILADTKPGAGTIPNSFPPNPYDESFHIDLNGFIPDLKLYLSSFSSDKVLNKIDFFANWTPVNSPVLLNPISLNLCSPSDVYTESVPSDVCKSAFDAIVIFAASFLELASPPTSTLDASFNQAFLLLIMFWSWLDRLLELSPLPNKFCLV